MNPYLLKKRKHCVYIFTAFIVVLSYTQCTPKYNTASSAINTTHKDDPNKGLKDYFKNYFPIGVAVSINSLRVDSALIVKEFNSFTPENDMKMGPIHPSENTYNWKNADAIVDFAVAHHIKVRGHNLCWHAQEAAWMFKGPDGQPASKELLLQRLKEHIFTVVKRYKGRVYAWDVVNEAVDDSNDTTQIYRKSNWYQVF